MSPQPLIIANGVFSSAVPGSGYACVGLVAVVLAALVAQVTRSIRRERRLQRQERAALRRRSGPDLPNVIDERGTKRRSDR
jgi:Flp pilus assembly protein TadB